MSPRSSFQLHQARTAPPVVSLDTNRATLTNLGLGQGLLRKAGAAFGEQLGPGPTSLDLHWPPIGLSMPSMALGKSKTRTGTKGQISSLKDGEKLDVFLARGCGQLSVW